MFPVIWYVTMQFYLRKQKAHPQKSFSRVGVKRENVSAGDVEGVPSEVCEWQWWGKTMTHVKNSMEMQLQS